MANTEITEVEYKVLYNKHKQAKYGTAPKEMREEYNIMKFKTYKYLTSEEKITLKIYYDLKFGDK